MFTIAQSSAVVWRHFLTVNQKYENGQLKDQKIKNSEIVKGKPLLKQWQLKELCSLGNEDRAFLLQKVCNLDPNIRYRVCFFYEIAAAVNDFKCTTVMIYVLLKYVFFMLSNLSLNIVHKVFSSY